MATFSSLKNKIKETINVDYIDRTTTLKVNMKNPENEFYGTFHGKLDALNASMTGGSISGVTITDARLLGNVILPGEYDLAKIGLQISSLNKAIEAESEVRAQDDNELDGKITAERSARELADVALDGRISTISVEIAGSVHLEEQARKYEDRLLSIAISAESEHRKHTDLEIVFAVTSISANLTSDINNLRNSHINDVVMLNLKIETLSTGSDDKIDALDRRLTAHELSNTTEFGDLNRELRKYAEDVRHYKIIHDGLTSKYPYLTEDFAVNILDVDGNAADAVNRTTGKNVAKVYDVGDAQETVKLHFLDFDDPALERAVSHGDFYTFDKTTRNLQANDPYKISYIAGLTGLSGSQFLLIPTKGKYLPVQLYGYDVGSVRNFSQDANGLVSGWIKIDSSALTPEINSFRDFGSREYNRSNLSCLIRGNDKIVFDGKDKIILKSSCTDKSYMLLNDEEGRGSMAFGRVYEETVLSDDSGLKSMTVSLYDPQTLSGSYVLNADSYFKCMVSAFTALQYDTEKKQFTLLAANDYYKYILSGYSRTDNANVIKEVLTKGYLVPGKANTELSSHDFDVLCAYIENMTSIAAFDKKMYKLTRAAGSDIWTYDLGAFANTISLSCDGTTLSIKTDNPIDEDGANCASLSGKTEPYSTSVNVIHQTSEGVAFEFPFVDETCLTSYQCNILSVAHDDQLPSFTLDTRASDGVIKVQVPDKLDGSLARQFCIVVRASIAGTSSKIKIQLVDSAGYPVTVFNNRSSIIEIVSDLFVALQVNEINDNMFLVLSLDLDLIRSDVSACISAIGVHTDEIAHLKERIKGSLQHRGMLNVIDKPGDFGGQNFHLSNLFYEPIELLPELSAEYDYRMPDSTNRPGTVLHRGYSYIVKKTDDNISSKWTVDGVKLSHGDAVIVKCLSDQDDGVRISAITSANIDVLDSLDDDVATVQMLKDLSNDLTGVIKTVSSDILTTVGTVSSEITAITDELSDILIEHKQKIDEISAKADFLLSVDHETVNYKGVIPQYTPSLDPSVATNWQLCELIYPNISASTGHLIDVKKGDLFKVNQTLSAIFDCDRSALTSASFGALDFFIVNDDVIDYHDIRLSSIDIFRNSLTEVELLSNVLMQAITALSSNLCGEIVLSVNNLTERLDSHDTQINGLLVALDELQYTVQSLTDNVNISVLTLDTKIDGVESRLTTSLALSASNLSSRLDGHDTQINALQSDCLTARDDINIISAHYDKTFAKDLHVDVDAGQDLSVDMLRMFSLDGSGSSYVMHLSCGTIVLVKE